MSKVKKIIFFLLPVFAAIIVFSIITFLIAKNTPGKGALQVTSVPQSNVYMDGKFIGKTPLCKCEGAEMLPTGDYTIKMVPVSGSLLPYEDTITINPTVLTVVDRSFDEPGKASGSIITLTALSGTQNAQLYIASFPTNTHVLVDNNDVGMTPLLLQNVTQSDHEITLTDSGYTPKTIRIHAVSGYKLGVIATLGTSVSNSPTPISISPTPIASPTAALGPQVLILSTPTGFLRVRDTPSLGGNEIGQVHPGETYPFVSEQDGWFEISLQNGKNGWISASYAKKE